MLILVGAGLLSVPGWVRSRVQEEATARGLGVEVDSVRIGLGRVWLSGVRVTALGHDAELKLNALSIQLGSGRVRAEGGSLVGTGDPQALLATLRGRARVGGRVGGSGRPVEASGLFVRWSHRDATVEAFGAGVRRSDTESAVHCDLVRARRPGADAEARGVLVALASGAGGKRLARIEAQSAVLRVVGGPASAAGLLGGRAPAPASTDQEGGAPLPARARALRAAVLPLLRDELTDDAQVLVGGISVRFERGDETLNFGPSRFHVARQGERLTLSLAPGILEPGATPLALNATVPLSDGSVQVIARGGPASLSSLGVQSGQLGLRDLRRATLAVDGVVHVSEDFESVAVDGKATVNGLVLERPELAAEPLGPSSFEVALKSNVRLDGSEVTVTSSEAQLEDFRVELSAHVTAVGGSRRGEGRLRVPLSGCQSMLDAVPAGLVSQVQGLRLDGSFGADLRLRFDSAAADEDRVTLVVQNECRVREVPPALSPHRFERPFLREVKGPDGSSVSIESGPGTPSWVSLDDMSRHLETAILICEDSRFHTHSGFDFRAIEDAIEADLKQGRFARGASTVSMQLAKNLYLGREKTLGRKLQEALLTLLLEQQLDKHRILELYLNVVELGPGLYGVGDAAQYYFATPARSLTLGQALYLASLLPNPTYSHFGPDGKLKPGWRSYLHRLMHIARKMGRIDDVELKAALEEEIAFRVPGAAPDLPSPLEGSEPEAPEPLEVDEAEPR